MWWSIDPDFDHGKREVTFIFQTVFEQHPDCSYITGAEVTCITDDTIAKRHGELCVKQIQELDGSEGTGESNVRVLDDRPLEDTRSCVGTMNKFKVLSTHDKPGEPALFDRMVNNIKVVVGRIQVVANVSASATGLYAYVTGPNGTVISRQQGMLPRQCTREAELANVLCSHNTRALINDGKTRFTTGNAYWKDFLKLADAEKKEKISPMAHGSPTIETYVPLCAARAPSALLCDNFPIGNFFSPQIGFPPLIEVAVTPKTTNFSTIFGSGEGLEGRYQASSEPIIFKAFDYDGHPLTLYDQQNDGQNKQDRSAKCWTADHAVPLTQLEICSEPGGTDDGKRCVPGNCLLGECVRHWPSKVCIGLPFPVEGRWCLLDADCIDPATNNTGTCTSTWSNCRIPFDFDRNEHRRVNNLIKLDYDWTFYGARDGYMPNALQVYTENNMVNNAPQLSDQLDYHPLVRTVSPSVMMHSLLVVDAPFLDVDNPSVATVDAPNDHILTPNEGESLAHLSPFSTIANRMTRKGSFTQAASSLLFSTYPCDAGKENQPPRFVSSPTDNTPPQGSTEIECPWYEPCEVDLYAKDFAIRPDGTESGALSQDRIAIESAFNIKEELVIAGTTIDCVGREGRDVGQIHCKWKVRHREARFPEVGYQKSAIGEMISTCFVALDIHQACTKRAARCTCRSMPLCVKIKFTGRPPRFVAPTPLHLNSRDDFGVPVPQRTDIPACEGVPIALTLQAVDDDGDAVRIFVWDVDVDELDPTRVSQHKYLEPGGMSQSDFFASVAINYYDNAQTCGAYDGYAASKTGANSAQRDITPSPAAGLVSSVKAVMGQYASEIEHELSPTLQIEYTVQVMPNSLKGNGLDIVRWETCEAAAGSMSGEAATTCREKRINGDQVVCAFAYDNSRAELKRWVGKTNPNGDDIPVWMRDHSNGDLASVQHCWRINIQAPPVFVSGPTGEATPFDTAWLEGTRNAFQRSTSDKTREEGTSFKWVRLAANSEYEYTFIAQDPQARDRVMIFIDEDPGIPRGVVVGPSICLPRNASEHPMCRAADKVDDWRAPIEARAGSECSKATRSISWRPRPEEAARVPYRVCLTVRDDSVQCVGVHQDATHMGWYGETQCLLMEVVEPRLEWDEATRQMLRDRVLPGYVGCNTSIPFTARDASVTIGTQDVTNGNYRVSVQAVGDYVLQRATATTSSLANPSALPVGWIPKRGEEGREYELCAVARDEFGMRALGLTCRGGARDGLVCGGIGTNELCGEGGECVATSCVVIRIERCRYCAQPGETLSNIAREYSMDMNWLRLWALNGNVNPEWGTVVRDPDFISTGSEEQHLFLGVTYRIKPAETLQAIASRFRTTVKSILMLNYDVDDAHGIQAGNELCIMPCSSFALEEQAGQLRNSIDRNAE